MRTVTANIKDNPDMPRAFVREDGQHVSILGSVILFQEIGEAEDHADIVRGLRAGGRSFVLARPDGVAPGDDRAQIPIAYRNDLWRKVGDGYVKAHNGLGGVSPLRGLFWVDLEPVTRKLPAVRWCNLHMVSGAWDGDHKATQTVRRSMWQTHFGILEARLAAWKREGITVVFGGDWNRAQVPLPHPTAKWVLNTPTTIDKIGVLQGSVLVGVNERGWLDLHSDHHGRWVDLGLRKRPTPPTPPKPPTTKPQPVAH
jgi:hypothetical protein